MRGYIYRLRGRLLKLGSNFKRLQDQARERRARYFESMGIDPDKGCLTWTDGSLAGIPSQDPLPRHFKYVKDSDKKFMSPKRNTKLGKEVQLKWDSDLKIPETPVDLCSELGLKTTQIVENKIFWPRCFFLKEGFFFLSGQRVIDQDLEEITKGEFEDCIAVERSNLFVQQQKNETV